MSTVKQKKTGQNACPFNSWYWHFLEKHRDQLGNNPRMGMMYRVWDKMKNKEELLEQAQHYMDNIETL